MGTRETRNTYRGTLMMACSLEGSATRLARRLRLPVPILAGHLAGATPIPNDLFLRVVDLVLAREHELRLTAARASRAKSERRTARTK